MIVDVKPALALADAGPLVPDAAPSDAGPADAPPAFAPYDAEFAVSPAGWTVSHDPHLNGDGEALLRFLLAHADEPPALAVHLRGTHTESRTSHVHYTDADGHRRTRAEHATESVADFDFRIDLSHVLLPAPTIWSVRDTRPAYRGRMFPETGIAAHKSPATRADAAAAISRAAARAARGLPPWAGDDVGPSVAMQSTWSVRQWADDYCQSKRYLKEFVFQKVVYGWDTVALDAALRAAIADTHYRGDVAVSFDISHDRILVRPDTIPARILSNHWLKLLLIITLIYPFIWLFRRYHPRGGGRWEVCGAAFALKREVLSPEIPPSKDTETDDETLPPYDAPIAGPSSASSSRALVSAAPTPTPVIGTREGEWFRQWESTIHDAVLMRFQDSTPLTRPRGTGAPRALLDGY